MSSARLTTLRKWLVHSPPGEWLLQQVRSLLIGTLSQGPVPQHVAFIMDGNRRYARLNRLETSEGHHLGFQALGRILEVCYRSGVKAVTVYAFSLENFKRPHAEVSGLMDLACAAFIQLSEYSGLLQQYNARFCFSGETHLMRPDVVEAIAKAVELTKNNTGPIFNVCGAYTSRREIACAIQATVVDYSAPQKSRPTRPFSESHITHTIQAAQDRAALDKALSKTGRSLGDTIEDDDIHDSGFTISPISSDDQLATSSQTSAISTSSLRHALDEPTIYPDAESINVDTLNAHMYSSNMPAIDLLVRTSDVKRLSDFLLWQCHETTPIVFVNCLWPEFDLRQFLPILLEWQSKRCKLPDSVFVAQDNAVNVQI